MLDFAFPSPLVLPDFLYLQGFFGSGGFATFLTAGSRAPCFFTFSWIILSVFLTHSSLSLFAVFNPVDVKGKYCFFPGTPALDALIAYFLVPLGYVASYKYGSPSIFLKVGWAITPPEF